MITLDRLAATGALPAPLLVVDLEAFDRNAAELLRRSGGRPLRLATKSVRVPVLVERALAAGFTGLMAYSLAEALWWSERVDDVLVGYPSVDRTAISRLVRDARARERVTVMVDDVAHLELLAGAVAEAGDEGGPVRVCVDVDASLRLGPVHLGVRRSPLRTGEEVAAIAREAVRRGLQVRGLMFYEAQVAGLPDTSPAVGVVKRLSLAELLRRRAEVVAAVEAELGEPVELVNGGGTGSVAATAADPAVTEVTSGSGLLSPTLFDGYRLRPGERRLEPAAFVGLDVVRRPAPGFVTAFSGGFVASGPASRSRLPRPVLPEGLRLTGTEGAGEVQTPLRGAAARGLQVGDRVWFRHAKAGEVMERFAEVVLVSGPAGAVVVESVPTYRGLSLCFG